MEVLLFISSVQAHMHPDSYGAVYGTSKMAATFLFQKMADELPPEKVQIISFHPGSVLTGPVREAGYDENTLPWDNGALNTLSLIYVIPLYKLDVLYLYAASSKPPCIILRLGSH